jgi:hypothetical protein
MVRLPVVFPSNSLAVFRDQCLEHKSLNHQMLSDMLDEPSDLPVTKLSKVLERVPFG